MTLDRTHTGIRRTLSLHSKHVYNKDNLWAEMDYHHREHIFVLRFNTNHILLKMLSHMFRGGLSELRGLRRLQLVFKVIVSIEAPMT